MPRSKFECPMSQMGQNRTLNRLHAMSALPPIADIGTQPRNVCFVPKADSCTAAKRYSISSLAVASSCGSILRPSDLAVLRLTTNMNLLGCKTGKSAGLAPLRTWPA